MRVFRLEPIKQSLSDPRWGASKFKEGCWVIAWSEQEARDTVQRFAARAINPRSKSIGKPIPTPPWSDPELATCETDDSPQIQIPHDSHGVSFSGIPF